MSSNDPFGSVTPRRPARPARASLASGSSSTVSAGAEGRYGSTRSAGHSRRPSLAIAGVDNEKTPRKPSAGVSPLLSDSSQLKAEPGDRSLSGGSRGSSSASSRATVGVGPRIRSAAGHANSGAATTDRVTARRSLVLNSTPSARGVASPVLKSAPLADRKRAAPAGEDDSFDADTSADMSLQRDADGFDADVSSKSIVLARERRRRSTMHAQEVQQLRSESRLASRQGHRDDEDAGEGEQDPSEEEELEADTSRRSHTSASTSRTSSRHKRNASYVEDDELVGATIDANPGPQQRFPSRPSHNRQYTNESSGTGGGTGTDTSGTEGVSEYVAGARGHSRSGSRTYKNGDGHTSGSSGVTTSTSGKRRRRKHSTASTSHQRRDSNSQRPATSFEERRPSSSGRGFDEFDQPHWQSAGARNRRISITQQQRNRFRSAESDGTAVRDPPESPGYRPRSSVQISRSPLPGGVQGHERSATVGDLDFSQDRPLSSLEDTYRPLDDYGTQRRDEPRRYTPRLSVSRSESRDDPRERAYTPSSAYRSSGSTIRDRLSRTPDPNSSTGMVGGTSRRAFSGLGSSTISSNRGGDDLSSTVRPSLDGVFQGSGSSGVPLCDRNMQRAFDQFEAYFSFPSVSGPADAASNPGSAMRPRSSSIATDAPSASGGSSRSTNGAATPSTPTSGGGHSAGALTDSVELVACFKAVTLMASELNSGLRRLREDVNEAHVDADVNNNPLANSLWRMGKDLAQLVKSSDTQLRNLTEGLIAFKRADRERERVRRLANATNSENGSVAGGGAGSSNRSISRMSSVVLPHRSPGSEARRNGREASAVRASISEYRRSGASSSSNLGLMEGERDRMMTSPTSLPSGRSSTASTGGANSYLNGASLSETRGSNGVGGARHLVTMQREGSNHSGSTTTSLSPRPPDTPTPMPPSSNGKHSDSASLISSTLTSRLRSVMGEKATPSPPPPPPPSALQPQGGRHGRSASEVIPSPVGYHRTSVSLSRATGAGAALRSHMHAHAYAGSPATTTPMVAEESPTASRSPSTTSSAGGAGSVGRRAGVSVLSALGRSSDGLSAASASATGSASSAGVASSSTAAPRAPASLSPRRSRLALPALTKNT